MLITKKCEILRKIDLLSTIKSWPPVIYSVMPVIAVIEPQLNSSSMTDALKEVNLSDD